MSREEYGEPRVHHLLSDPEFHRVDADPDGIRSGLGGMSLVVGPNVHLVGLWRAFDSHYRQAIGALLRAQLYEFCAVVGDDGNQRRADPTCGLLIRTRRQQLLGEPHCQLQNFASRMCDINLGCVTST